ncbi:hypothetical protein [Mycobacterium sp. URHB0044]|uniref:hypothetical protein n=1 Tax=Mycobacterium sp. URHB0044 TaxID=1380386 RepID=UPI0012DE8C1B|nr:hypothetical protein [Mycobacterium sp. URHB0044]
MEIRNLVAGTAIALAIVGAPMAGVLGGPVGSVGVASADGCGSGTGAGGGVWCVPTNTAPLVPTRVLGAGGEGAGELVRDVRCAWPSCGPRWWPDGSLRPMR